MKYHTRIERLEQLSEQERTRIKEVTETFPFRSNDYYLSLINWDDPDDPIRKIIIPNLHELEKWGRLDPSDEESYTIIPGLEHKYHSTALLVISNVCEGICRYCFRKRVFIDTQRTYLHDPAAAMQYITEHKEITNVLLSGGDPFALETSKLENIIRQLREIEHVQIIRIGTKMPAFNPHRIIKNTALLEMISKYSTEQKKIYIMTHFDHPRELTDVAVKSVNLLHKAGALLANQTPLIRGVNSNPLILAELLGKLSFIGAVPYYIFQCRPAIGNKSYTVPIEKGYEIIEQAKSMVSGLAKRARYTMSHTSGKIEILGKTKKFVYFKYLRAADDQDSGRFLVFKSNPNAYWFDDYDEVVRDYPINLPYRAYGPE
ncbi:MAG: KamA family radical SAM protein [Planctomycetes bacterium]|nr:KamA family radical SAM protein [Planctomycetota bacterium]MBL7144488.1 KamA family radical SAM protein [Phycisphaerae bacterium]